MMSLLTVLLTVRLFAFLFVTGAGDGCEFAAGGGMAAGCLYGVVRV